ncbi:MAG: hypothetical protein PVI90_05365 [Desulfobacteraceae bacterium]|jgi:hypothetical protein
MQICEICKTSIKCGEEKKFRDKILCEDCYIDENMPKMPKAHYNNSAEFMNRLKDSYSVRRQQFD